MPRLPYSLLRRAKNISPLLPLVLRGCRELPAAINELRWLHEYVKLKGSVHKGLSWKSRALLKLCQRRANGEPLQYLLGTQPFGDLEIKCRPGVLIPRPETEAFTTHLAELLLKIRDREPLKKKGDPSSNESLTIVDFCTGTGCIALLLQSLLSKGYPRLDVTGVDISNYALSLARENLRHNQKDNPNLAVKFQAGNLFTSQKYPSFQLSNVDIVISNPPYISETSFKKETTRSVRNWEPKLALVPSIVPDIVECAPEDIFYDGLLKTYRTTGSRILLMEVGDSDQAIRVSKLAIQLAGPCRIQIWRDWPDEKQPNGAVKAVKIGTGEAIEQDVLMKGVGKARSVLILWGKYIDLLHPDSLNCSELPLTLDCESW